MALNPFDWLDLQFYVHQSVRKKHYSISFFWFFNNISEETLCFCNIRVFGIIRLTDAEVGIVSNKRTQHQGRCLIIVRRCALRPTISPPPVACWWRELVTCDSFYMIQLFYAGETCKELMNRTSRALLMSAKVLCERERARCGEVWRKAEIKDRTCRQVRQVHITNNVAMRECGREWETAREIREKEIAEKSGLLFFQSNRSMS